MKISITIAEMRLHVNYIFQKKSEVGEQNRMFAGLEKWSATGHNKGIT